MFKKSLSIVLVLVLCIVSITFSSGKEVNAANYKIKNPRISGELTTWDCVYFGRYYKTSATLKKPIKWRVLEVNGDNAFLLADEILDCERYNEKLDYVTWETCTLRTWLNSSFCNEAFNSSEKASIYDTLVVNKDNPDLMCHSEGGNDTLDKVYLLSIDEASNIKYGFNPYFSEESQTRGCKASNYASVKGCGLYEMFGSGYEWWLRSPGMGNNYAVTITRLNSGFLLGTGVDYWVIGVRPVLHLNLSHNTWTRAGIVRSNGEANEIYTPKPTIKKIEAKKKALIVRWKEEANITGYKLQYSRKKNFKKAKTITIRGSYSDSKRIKKLKRKKKYYVRMRTYKIIEGETFFSAWSKVKKKKTK